MYQLDTQKKVIKAGDILIVSDQHVVDSYQHSPDMEGLCMMMSVHFFREIIQNVSDVSSLFLFSRQHPVMKLEQREIDTFKEYFQVIKQKISDEGNHFRKDLIKTLLLAMFYDLSNIIYRVKQDDKPHTRAEIIFTRFIQLVEKNFREERRVGWYAQQLCITAKYLSEKQLDDWNNQRMDFDALKLALARSLFEKAAEYDRETYQTNREHFADSSNTAYQQLDIEQLRQRVQPISF